MHVKAAGDRQGEHIISSKTQLTMHNNTSVMPLGKAMLQVGRGGHTHLLRFFVLKSSAMPILGKNSSVGMELVQILVHSLNHIICTKLNPILWQYHDVFSGLGELPGEYTIQAKANSVPVINPPHRLPVSLRSVVKAELDMMVDEDIITLALPRWQNQHLGYPVC